MHSFLATRLNALTQWRTEVDRQAGDLTRWLKDQGLYGDDERGQMQALRERLRSDKLLVAFVGEFSRGKSELINALLFAQHGRRGLPASAGRTTMCPVELRWDAQLPPSLSLLPLHPRLQGASLFDLREQDEPWTRIPLDPADESTTASALDQVTRMRRVGLDEARALGLWDDTTPDANPTPGRDGLVEVPAWRHAIVNFPHPLLQRGLVVLDTPGLNAIGSEAELTLGLLPAAHAVVFVLAADTGVTRSDLAFWREELATRELERVVVLNKADTLADPRASAQETARQIALQCERTAQDLGIDAAQVLPVSARMALSARLTGEVEGLMRSGLVDLESSLAALLPRQQELLSSAAAAAFANLGRTATRRLVDRRRQNAEQLLELRGLSGKSGAKIDLLLQRLAVQAREFEDSAARIGATRSVHLRLQRAALAPLSRESLRDAAVAWTPQSGLRALLQDDLRGFDTLMTGLRAALAQSVAAAREMHQMLDASFAQLNADFGFAFAVPALPDMDRAGLDLSLIERSGRDHLGGPRALRSMSAAAVLQFRRVLLSRLRQVFETATEELQRWSKSASAQLEAQLAERRAAFVSRREALERIRAAAGELESRISELEASDHQLRTQLIKVAALADGARSAAFAGGEATPDRADRRPGTPEPERAAA